MSVAWVLIAVGPSIAQPLIDRSQPSQNDSGVLSDVLPSPQPVAENGQALSEIHAYPTKPPVYSIDGRVDYVLGQQIHPTRGYCDTCSCSCGGPCRLGDGCPHPWRLGPGCCDDWCVGPHWDVVADGILLHRENLDLANLEALWGAPMLRFEQYGYEVGARGYATGWSELGYGIQLGYVGVDHWLASGRVTIPNVANREFENRTGIHSGELNILPDVQSDWRLLLGVRYAELHEDFYIYDEDIENSSHVKNKMIGFQLGARRDLWVTSDRFYVEGLVNGGIYRNRMKRINRSGTVADGTSIIDRAEDNNIAFLGEAAMTAVYRLNECLAVRGGYQVLFVDGVMKGDDAIQGPGLLTGSILYHGLQVGLEYRR